MITNLFLNTLVLVVSFIFSWLPEVTELPFGLDSIVSWAVGLYNAAISTLPYLEVVKDVFIWALVFEMTILLVKFFLGSRLPIHK